MWDYDVVVIGGGIHGAGVAQAGAAAGYRVLVLEADSPGAGTSGRSSKLIHGGLRYLESWQFGLVHECLQERRILLRLAPGLVRLVPFYIPVYEDSSRGRWKLRTGLSLYALLGGLGREYRFRELRLSERAGLNGLAREGLRSVFQYWDAQTDDKALTIAVLQSARNLGAELLCPARFLRAERTDGGYTVHFQGRVKAARRCRVLVNAAGPWINRVLESIDPRPIAPDIVLLQGAHIVLDGPPCEGIYYVEAPTDRRPVFIMPWKGHILIGTTETPSDGEPANVTATATEIEYLLSTFRHYFPGEDRTLCGSFAGVRVIPAARFSSGNNSRETLLLVDDRRDPRMVTIAGGKLTSYRSTSLKALRTLRSALPPAHPIADTSELPISPA